MALPKFTRKYNNMMNSKNLTDAQRKNVNLIMNFCSSLATEEQAIDFALESVAVMCSSDMQDVEAFFYIALDEEESKIKLEVDF